MSKRKYTHVQELEGEILAMRKEGATRQEIADRLGLSKSQIKNWINRYNRKRMERSFGTYGYRRMWLAPEKLGIHRNPKTILRIMEEC